MSAMEEIVGLLVSGGMDAIAAARLVMRAVIEETTPKRSKEAARAARYRQRKRDEITTRHDAKTDHKRDESVTNRDVVTRTSLFLEEGRESSRTRHASRKRTSLPDGFLLSEKMRAYAQSKGLDPPKITREFERFCDHHRAKGSLFADWEAAWRTWVGNALEYSRKNGGGHGGGFKWNGIEGVI